MNIDLIICSSLWIIYSFFEGIREAYLRYRKDTSKSNIELKIELSSTTQRLIVLGLLTYILYSNHGILSILFAASAILVFIYIQNKTYFVIKRKLDTQHSFEKEESKLEKPYIYVKDNIRKKVGTLGVISQMVLSIIN